LIRRSFGSHAFKEAITFWASCGTGQYLLGNILIAGDYEEIDTILQRCEIDLSSPMCNGYEILRRAKTESFTSTRIKPKRNDAPNSAASLRKGNGAMVISQRANVEIMATSAIEPGRVRRVTGQEEVNATRARATSAGRPKRMG